MVKATMVLPKPVEAKVNLELSQDEARAIRQIFGMCRGGSGIAASIHTALFHLDGLSRGNPLKIRVDDNNIFLEDGK
jgi:hypothetical protein